MWAVAGSFAVAVVVWATLWWGGQGAGPAAVAAVAVAATSPWALGERARSEAGRAGAAGALAFAALGLVALHVGAQLGAVPGGAGALLVEAAYETLKVVLLLAAGAYVLLRIRARDATGGSGVRYRVAYWVVAAGFYVLMLGAEGQIIAAVWAFASGAAFRSGETAANAIESRPLAEAVFLAAAFLPPALDMGGRAFPSIAAIAATVVGAFVVKLAVAAATSVRTPAPHGAFGSGLWIVPPGEVAILALAYGVSHWLVEPLVYFGVLSFVFVSLGANLYAGKATVDESVRQSR